MLDAGVTTLSEELGRRVTVAEVLPLVRARLTQLLAWEPYAATPDYEPRPEPGRRPVAVDPAHAGLRVPVLNPRG